MTQFMFPRSPLPFLVLCLLVLTATAPSFAQRKATAAKSVADKKKSASKSELASTRSKSSAKKTVDKKTADKRADARSAERDRRDSKQTAKNNRKDSKRDAKSDDSKRDAKSERTDKDKGKSSRRERLAESRREAARREQERREAEERRREEAARRAEIARQARLAAIARARAAEQALRNETVANILKDDTTGEDLEVRRAAIAALGERAGSVVVIEPMTGRVLTIVNQDWGVRRGFKPCSTIKLVTGLAGVEAKVIAPTETVAAWNGRYRLDLTDSLAYSNNTYFQRVGGTVGFDRMIGMAREFGLGQPTGINHARESAGQVPLFKTGYAVNHMSSHGDDFKVTPVQLATMASAIANGGNLLVPHLPRTPDENVYFRTEMRRRISVQPESLRRLVPGMVGAVNYGSGRQAHDPTQVVGGKTGSCIDDGTWVGLFTSYAPIDDPRLAVAVVIKGSGARGKYAAGIAGRVYRSLNHRFGRRTAAPANLATIPGGLAPRPKLDAAAARAVSDEDREADEATLDAESNATNAATGIQKVLKPITRPVETTTRPAAPSAAPRQGTLTPPNITPGSTERPRRVLSTSP